jgi:Glycosyltransferase family 87
MLKDTATPRSSQSKFDNRSATAPRLLALFSLTQFLLLVAVGQAWQSGPFPTRNFYVGFDFSHFFKSADLWIGHRSPYANPAFPAPPASLIPYVLLHRLPERTAHELFFVVMMLLVVITMGVFCYKLRLTRENTVLAFIVMFTFAPFYASLNGGNIDSLMLVLLLGAVLVRRQWIQDLLLGISIALKVYSAVILVEWIVRRRWQRFARALLAAILITVPFYPYVGDMVRRLLWRTSAEFSHENISPAAAFQALLGHGRLAMALYLLFWGTTFVLMLYYGSKDREGTDEFETLRLLPWMMTFPSLVLSYVGIIALPIIALLFGQSQSRELTFWERVSLVGIALLNFYPLVFARLLPLTDAAMVRCTALFNPLNAIGTTLILIGICAQRRADEGNPTSSRAVSS